MLCDLTHYLLHLSLLINLKHSFIAFTFASVSAAMLDFTLPVWLHNNISIRPTFIEKLDPKTKNLEVAVY